MVKGSVIPEESPRASCAKMTTTTYRDQVGVWGWHSEGDWIEMAAAVDAVQLSEGESKTHCGSKITRVDKALGYVIQ